MIAEEVKLALIEMVNDPPISQAKKLSDFLSERLKMTAILS